MPLRYLLAVAAGKAPAPLLCFLHGYGEAAPLALEKAMRLHGPLHPRSAPIAARDFIVVAPQLPLAGDLWHRYADDVRALIADICAKQAVERMYLTGFSYGGNGVFDLAVAQPDLWAALWAGEVARAQKQAFVRALALGEPDRRIWADAGKGHVGSARAAYADERIYHWLLRHVR